jgi:hypothetical protein
MRASSNMCRDGTIVQVQTVPYNGGVGGTGDTNPQQRLLRAVPKGFDGANRHEGEGKVAVAAMQHGLNRAHARIASR